MKAIKRCLFFFSLIFFVLSSAAYAQISQEQHDALVQKIEGFGGGSYDFEGES